MFLKEQNYMMVTSQKIFINFSSENIPDLVKSAKEGNEESIERIINIFKPLINCLASKLSYNNNYKEDLVQEGMIGLLYAIRNYDYSKSDNFCMYAYFWIKQAISRTADKLSSMIRIPLRKQQKMRKAKACNCNDEISVEEISALKFIFLSIENSGKENEEFSIVDKLPSDDTPEKFLLEKSDREDLDNLLSVLDERERDIIEKRYGLTTFMPMTLREIAKKYDLTSESIRKIEIRALNKMRQAYVDCEIE